jgi:flagellar hook assembly protein FlgD
MVTLDIFNIAGQKIKTLVNESLNPGHHLLLWDGTTNNGQKAASGVYFYKLQANNHSKTLKMVMLK